MHNLGGALDAMGDPAAAADAFAGALAVQRRLGGGEAAAESAAALGRLRADAGDEAAAAALFLEALDVYRHTLGDHSKTADVAMSLSLALLGLGQEREAEGEALYQEAADMQERIRVREEALEAAEVEEAEARLASAPALSALNPGETHGATVGLDSGLGLEARSGLGLRPGPEGDALVAEAAVGFRGSPGEAAAAGSVRGGFGGGGGVGPSSAAAARNASKLSGAQRGLEVARGRGARGSTRRTRRAQLQGADGLMVRVDMLLGVKGAGAGAGAVE